MPDNDRPPYAAAGELIRSERKRLGLDQRELARRCGVSQQTVSGWERGTSRPRTGQAAELAVLLGMNVVNMLAVLGYIPLPDAGPGDGEWCVVTRTWFVRTGSWRVALDASQDVGRADWVDVRWHPSDPRLKTNAERSAAPAPAVAAQPGMLRIGSKPQETPVATLYLHPDDNPGSHGRLLGAITPTAVALEIVKRWNAAAEDGNQPQG